MFLGNLTYDALSRLRIKKEYSHAGALTNEVRYVYWGRQVLEERGPANIRSVVYTRGLDLSGSWEGAGGIGGLLARTANSSSAFYHNDVAGNITSLVNSQGQLQARYLYDGFGNLMARSGSLADANVYRFSSKELLPNTGLYYYGFRFYEPNLQRWLNRDPIGIAGGLNVYRYVGNNPLSRIDPHGLVEPKPLILGGVVSEVLDFAANVVDRVLNDPPPHPVFPQPGWQFDSSPKPIKQLEEPTTAQLLMAFGPLAVLKPLSSCPKRCLRGPAAAEAAPVGARFEGLTAEQIATAQKAMKEEGMSDANLLIKGADMPANFAGMTLGVEGFAINRSLFEQYDQLVYTLKHEYQHILDRRALGDPGAYGQALEDAAREAECKK